MAKNFGWNFFFKRRYCFNVGVSNTSDFKIFKSSVCQKISNTYIITSEISISRNWHKENFSFIELKAIYLLRCNTM